MSEINVTENQRHPFAPPTAPPSRSTLGKSVAGLPHGLSSQRPVRVTDGMAPLGNAPSNSPWQELKEQSVFAFESGLLPRSIDSRQKAITIALMGKEIGLTPMQSLCGIYVVNGMTAMRGHLMLRLIYERVAGARITVLTPPDKADQECSVEMTRPHGQPQVFRYTVEEARKAGFMNKPIWQQHTSTMLRWAAIRTGARVVFADAIAGCYMEDELPGTKASADGSAPENPEVVLGHAVAPAEEAPREKREASADVAPVVESAAPAPVVSEPEPEPMMPPVHEERTLVRELPVMKKVTEKQVHRLYAIAHEKHWSRQEVGGWMEKWFHKREAKELNRLEYDRLCNYLLAQPVRTAASDAANH